MYAWMWRKLPGPWPAKLVWTLAAAAGTVLLLFTVVFPWLEPRLPFNDVTVDDSSASSSSSTSPEVGPSPVVSPQATAPDGTVREITSPGTGPTITPSVVGSPAPSAS